MTEGPVTRTVFIKVKNFGDVTESEVHYAVSAVCSDEDGDGAECTGNVVYSAACSGDATSFSDDGDLDPAEVVRVLGCTATYSNPTGDDKWLHTLVITHCGSDGGIVCSTNDGGVDSNPSNNIAIKKTKVVP